MNQNKSAWVIQNSDEMISAETLMLTGYLTNRICSTLMLIKFNMTQYCTVASSNLANRDSYQNMQAFQIIDPSCNSYIRNQNHTNVVTNKNKNPTHQKITDQGKDKEQNAGFTANPKHVLQFPFHFTMSVAFYKPKETRGHSVVIDHPICTLYKAPELHFFQVMSPTFYFPMVAA